MDLPTIAGATGIRVANATAPENTSNAEHCAHRLRFQHISYWHAADNHIESLQWFRAGDSIRLQPTPALKDTSNADDSAQ